MGASSKPEPFHHYNRQQLQSMKEQRWLPGPSVRNLYIVQGTLTTRTPLHIGEGQEPGQGTEGDAKSGDRKNLQKVIREAAPVGDSDGGFPYIPATSLRGVLRAWCEGMLGAYGREVASLNGDGNVDLEKLDRAGRPAGGTDDADPDQIDEQRALELRNSLDLVSGLFGTTYWRSKLEVDPARISSANRSPTKDGKKAELLFRVPRVAIDPHLGIAEDSKLFETELVRANVAFNFVLRARNLRRWELGLLFLALDAFNDPHFPLRIGGHTQQGYGCVTLDITGVERLGSDGDESSDVLLAWMKARRAGRDGEVQSNPQKLPDPYIKSFEEAWSHLLLDSGAL